MTATSPLVIKLGGLAVEDPARASALLSSIAALHNSGERIVLVHGGGNAVDQHLTRLGIESKRREGLRVTGDTEIAEVVAVLAGKVNKAIVGALQAALGGGAPAVGLCLGDGLTAHARRLAPGGVDIGHVGEVVGGDPRLLRILLAERFLPVISPIAMDEHGAALNINGDDAAAAVASILGARLLVLLTDVPGVLDASKQPIAQLSHDDALRLIENGVISGGMVPKVRAALRAADRSGIPTIIASWNDTGSIAALASGKPVGTRFTPSHSGRPLPTPMTTP